MSDNPVGTVRTMLNALLEETEDSEVHFKLRTSLQLLEVIEEQSDAGRQALENADLDEDVRRNLQELGYLD